MEGVFFEELIQGYAALDNILHMYYFRNIYFIMYVLAISTSLNDMIIGYKFFKPTNYILHREYIL